MEGDYKGDLGEETYRKDKEKKRRKREKVRQNNDKD